MSHFKTIVLVGATSAMAQHCARLWLQRQPVKLFLLGRDAQRLERMAADLKVRSAESEIHTVLAPFSDPVAIEQTVKNLVAQGPIDIALIAQGWLPEQNDCQNNLSVCREALEINALSPVLYAEAFAQHMSQSQQGTIALIGSVAGDRGRKSNYVYGAAKGLITRYAQGMQHRFARSGVSVVLIKPGPTDTPMTASIKNQGARLASAEEVAHLIVQGIEKKKDVIYAPSRWALIMMVVRHIPGFIFKKMNI